MFSPLTAIKVIARFLISPVFCKSEHFLLGSFRSTFEKLHLLASILIQCLLKKLLSTLAGIGSGLRRGIWRKDLFADLQLVCCVDVHEVLRVFLTK